MGQFRLPFSAANLEPARYLVGLESRFFMPLDSFATPQRRGLVGVTNPQTDPWHLMVAAVGPYPVLFELDGNDMPQPALTWPTELHRPWYQAGDVILIQEWPAAQLRERFPRAEAGPREGTCIVGFRIRGIDVRTVTLQFVVFDEAGGPTDLGVAGTVSFQELEEQFREVRRFARQRP